MAEHPPAEPVSPVTLITIGLASLLTFMDMFGPQAIAPALAAAFGATPAHMGVALNAATVGMAVGGLLTVFVAGRIGRKQTMVAVLFLLTVPTFLLGLAPNIIVFAALRVMQGLLMCASFTVAIAYVAEEWGASGAAPIVMAAYVAGNVGSNLLGRVVMGAVAQYASWSDAFFLLAVINLAGGLLLWLTLPRGSSLGCRQAPPVLTAFRQHLSDPRLRGAFGIGFLILFCFIGTFTYVNFRLAGPRFNLGPAAIGALYSVFVASLLSTPAAGHAVRHLGDSASILLGALVSVIGLLLTLGGSLSIVATGLTLVGAGTFFSQAVATGFTGRAGGSAKVAASGLYLAFYYSGGLCGALLLGLVYQARAWPGCVAVMAFACALMAAIPFAAWREGKVIGKMTAATLVPQGAITRGGSSL
jgi:predicted MFS family arabinose efflux permease